MRYAQFHGWFVVLELLHDRWRCTLAQMKKCWVFVDRGMKTIDLLFLRGLGTRLARLRQWMVVWSLCCSRGLNIFAAGEKRRESCAMRSEAKRKCTTF